MLSRRCWIQPASASLKAIPRYYGTVSNNTLNLDLSRPIQSYISRSRDPYINLSIEHYLLQKSSPDSTILLLYVNRPSIIIGRNQNPWLEVNLGLLKASLSEPTGNTAKAQIRSPRLANVDLVRRRSGGGTVFHDEGNVNWTVISPSSTFTRDKHAEMVVRALRTLGISRSRVNERHDIVLDQGSSSFAGSWGPDADTHATPWQTDSPKSLKVSGSAYKLTRQRALHHGTALLNSPNLKVIPHYLRSPAKAFLKGRGVDSVSSPVGNILLENDDFIKEVQRQFAEMYGGHMQAEVVDEQWLEVEQVEKGWKELKSLEWTYLQTPQFSLSNLTEDASRPISSKPDKIYLNVKNGIATELDLNVDGVTREQSDALLQSLGKESLHNIKDWPLQFKRAGINGKQALDMAKWVQSMLSVHEEATD